MSDFPGEDGRTLVIPISKLLKFPPEVSGGLSSEQQRLDAILILFKAGLKLFFPENTKKCSFAEMLRCKRARWSTSSRLCSGLHGNLQVFAVI